MGCSKSTKQGLPEQIRRQRSFGSIISGVCAAKDLGHFLDSPSNGTTSIDSVRSLSQHLHSIAAGSKSQHQHLPSVAPVSVIHTRSEANDVCPNPTISTAGLSPISNKRLSQRPFKDIQKNPPFGGARWVRSKPRSQLPHYLSFAAEDYDHIDLYEALALSPTYITRAPRSTSKRKRLQLCLRMNSKRQINSFSALKKKVSPRRNRSSISNIKVISMVLPRDCTYRRRLRVAQSLRSLQTLADKQQKRADLKEPLLLVEEQREMPNPLVSAEQDTGESLDAPVFGQPCKEKLNLDDLVDMLNIDKDKYLHNLLEPSRATSSDTVSAAEVDKCIIEEICRDQNRRHGCSPRSTSLLQEPKMHYLDVELISDNHSSNELPELVWLLPGNPRSSCCSITKSSKLKPAPLFDKQVRRNTTCLKATVNATTHDMKPPSAPPERPLPAVPHDVQIRRKDERLRDSVEDCAQEISAAELLRLGSQLLQHGNSKTQASPFRNKAGVPTVPEHGMPPSAHNLRHGIIARNAKISELKRKHISTFMQRSSTTVTSGDSVEDTTSAKVQPSTADASALSNLDVAPTQVSLPAFDVSKPLPLPPITRYDSHASSKSLVDRRKEWQSRSRTDRATAIKRNRRSFVSMSPCPKLATSQIMTIAETNPDTTHGFQSGTVNSSPPCRRIKANDVEICSLARPVQGKPTLRTASASVCDPASTAIDTVRAKVGLRGYGGVDRSTLGANVTDVIQNSPHRYEELVKSHKNLEEKLAHALDNLDRANKACQALMSAHSDQREEEVITPCEDANTIRNTVPRAHSPCKEAPQTPPPVGTAGVSGQETRKESLGTSSSHCLASSERVQSASSNDESKNTSKQILMHSPGSTESNDTELSCSIRSSPSISSTTSQETHIASKNDKSRPEICTVGNNNSRSNTRSASVRRTPSKRLSKNRHTHNPTIDHVSGMGVMRSTQLRRSWHQYRTVSERQNSPQFQPENIHVQYSDKLLPPLRYQFDGTGRLRFDFTAFEA